MSNSMNSEPKSVEISKIEGYLGVDTGGTFTDFYLQHQGAVRTHKVLSTPAAPEQAILQGIDELGVKAAVVSGLIAIVHGSTVATNAALEGKGARTAYVTNRGFADVLTLGRQQRVDIYALQPQALTLPVPTDLCLEVDCRRDAQGKVVTSLSLAQCEALRQVLKDAEVEAVAINFLHSYVDDQDEITLAQVLAGDRFVCHSSQVLPEPKEYERGIATWLNAWLGPKVEGYLRQLQDQVGLAPLGVMQSSGGTMDARQASRRAVNLLLSGPAGGLAAACALGRALGKPRLLTFDMGGTSTDVALIDGDLRLTNEGRIGSYPVAVPMVDMHTIGAGGGSIAYLDQGGLLHVGPESAGAEPGPACYGRGGRQPTVTDANAVLGRLRPEHFLGGRMELDLAATEQAVGALAKAMGVSLVDAALGIIALANEHMVRALRVISVQKGYAPQDFELCCFGGAGGLHVCALAESLGVSRILLPANGGVLSAAGMLVAPKERHLSRTINAVSTTIDSDAIDLLVQQLERQGREQLLAEGVVEGIDRTVSFDCRYQGQSFTLNVPRLATIEDSVRAFHQAHQARYGHALDFPVQLVNVRVAVTAPSALANGPIAASEPKVSGQVKREAVFVELPALGKTQIIARDEIEDRIAGPAIIWEALTTTLLAAGWKAERDAAGHLLFERV